MSEVTAEGWAAWLESPDPDAAPNLPWKDLSCDRCAAAEAEEASPLAGDPAARLRPPQPVSARDLEEATRLAQDLPWTYTTRQGVADGEQLPESLTFNTGPLFELMCRLAGGRAPRNPWLNANRMRPEACDCLLYTSDAADDQ